MSIILFVFDFEFDMPSSGWLIFKGYKFVAKKEAANQANSSQNNLRAKNAEIVDCFKHIPLMDLPCQVLKTGHKCNMNSCNLLVCHLHYKCETRNKDESAQQVS